MSTMDTVRRFFERAPQFTQLARAMSEFARNDFRQSLAPDNFLAFVERETGDLDEESMLEYCRMHLEFAGVWNLGLEPEVRTCWRMADVLDHWQSLIQGSSQPGAAATAAS